jgi:peptidoglycan/xylan/chitin deacetylase (PgdA/CDA1 family)
VVNSSNTRLIFLLLLPLVAGTVFTGDRAFGQRHAKDSLDGSEKALRLLRAPRLPAVPPQVIAHGVRNEKSIALTFDACSTREPGQYDGRVTQVLLDTHTPATIFLGGKWMQEEPEQVKVLASTPQFELANHTFHHPHMTTVSDDRIAEELQRTQDMLYTLTGRHATLFRPPYGEYNDRVVTIAAAMGLTTVEYDLASGDPDLHATKEKLIEYVTEKARNGSIIVMHINRRGWHTAEALPAIIARLRERGFTFVTVGELIRNMHHSGG